MRPTCPRPATAFALVAALVSGLAAARPAAAQEEPAPGPAKAPAAASEDAAPQVDPANLLQEIDALELVVATRPRPPLPRDFGGRGEEYHEARRAYTRDDDAWRRAVTALPKLVEMYRRAAGESAAPRVAFAAGLARVQGAQVCTVDERDALLADAVTELERFLAAADPEDAQRPEAEHALVRAILLAAKADPAQVAAAAPHADRGVAGYLKAGRSAPAGELAYLMLESLVATGGTDEAARLAEAWHVGETDFGPSGESVRRVTRFAALRPGRPLPKLPELQAQDGKPMPWKDLAGQPYVLHFFNSGISSTTREIETVLRPLREKWKERGLRFVGCSTDRAMSAEEIATTKHNWDEWGKTDRLFDGNLDSVRGWTEEEGIDWPWYWDGRFTQNALVQALGVPVNRPYAVLVGADGVIRWAGEPYKGLAEAAAELFAQ